MKVSAFLPYAATLAIAATFFLTPTPSHADTYQIFDLGPIGNSTRDPIGITASGTAVIYDRAACSVNQSGCWETFVDGSLVSESTTPPDLTYDNGTPCTVSVGGAPAQGLCNNGHELYAYSPNGQGGFGFYTGPDPANDAVGGGEVFLARLNSSGDFILVDGLNPLISDSSGEIYEFIDTNPVPEPSSILFLGTGAITAIGMIRHRLR